MSHRLLKWSRWLLIPLFCWQINAQAVTSPLVMLQRVSTQILNNLDHNMKRLRSAEGNVYLHGVINRYLIPHVNVNRMATTVVGRRYWTQGTSAQKRTFINEFTKMIISTYSGALKSYNHDKLRFYPIGNAYKKAKYLSVRSLLIRPSGQRIPLSYNLMLVSGRWKIYDFSIDNISMAQNYRSQFATVLRSSGFSGLIKRLQRHNKNF